MKVIPWWTHFHLCAAEGGDVAGGIALILLADAVRANSISSEQREFLATALGRIGAATSGPDRIAATKQWLLLGRRPGRTSPLEARRARMELAREVWEEVGLVRGKALLQGVRTVAARRGLGKDIRRVQKAYGEFAPMFAEMEAAADHWDNAREWHPTASG